MAKEMTAADWLAKVKKNGSELKNVPDNLKTTEVCLAAVQSKGYALEYVPDNLKTAEICLAAVQQDGYALLYVPTKLESVILAAVKLNGRNLSYVDTQTFDVCLAAFQKSGEVVLKYVDPELRTAALLKACGIDVADYKGIETFTAIDEEGWESDNETISITVCGKGDAQWLSSAQKHLRRAFEFGNFDLEEDEDTEWENTWLSHPMEAAAHSVEFSPDKSSFTMTFSYGRSPYKSIGEFEEHINDTFYDNSLPYAEKLEIFLYAYSETLYSNSCEYIILGPFMDGETCREKEDWTYIFGDYEDSSGSGELNMARLSYIEKRRDLWLVEGSADKTAIAKAKKALASAKKQVNDLEKSYGDSEEDDEE
jgi:hypothetical protein